MENLVGKMYFPRLVRIVLPAVPKSKFAVVMLTLFRGEGLVHGEEVDLS